MSISKQIAKNLILVLYLITSSTLFALSDTGTEDTNSETILMVVSSYGEDQGETKPGYEFDEFAKAYLVFKQNGYHVEIASPAGGPVEADKHDPNKPYTKLVMADTEVMDKLNNTLSTADILNKDYAAIFIVGGKGAMFDLPEDKHLQQLVARLYENNRVISAVCHGPAALVDVKLSNGDYLVSGKKVNGFTNIEEKAFSKKWASQFKFMLEDKLIERGGAFESSPMMLSHVAVDDRLITGQNPFSTTQTALEVVKALGKSPRPHQVFKEDKTIALITRVLDGETNALKELVTTPDKYQAELVGMYGYYFINLAANDDEVSKAVILMEGANEIMNHPVLKMSIIKGYQQLGKKTVAREKAVKLVEEMPDNDKAKALLASLEAS